MKVTLKIILIGESVQGSAPGKTNLIQRYVNNQYREGSLTTIGVDFKTYDFDFLGKKIKIHLWDTPGQGRFQNITKRNIKGSDIIIMVYSVDDRRSFEKIKTFWLPTVKEECGENGK